MEGRCGGVNNSRCRGGLEKVTALGGEVRRTSIGRQGATHGSEQALLTVIPTANSKVVFESVISLHVLLLVPPNVIILELLMQRQYHAS